MEVEHWSIEKALACLKLIVHPDILPPISQEELDRMKYMEGFQGEEKLFDFLKIIYKKSNGKLEIYGTVKEMIGNLRKIDTVPEFVAFSWHPEIEISATCALLTPCVGYSESIGSPVYSARSNIAINIYKSVTALVKSFAMNQLVIVIFSAWQITHLNKMIRGFKGTYDFLPFDYRLPFLAELEDLIKAKRNIKFPKEPVTIESFYNLKAYLDPKDEKVLNDVLTPLLKENQVIAENQVLFNVIYAEAVFLIENIKKIYERHAELFIPYAKPKIPSIHLKPFFRLFVGCAFRYYLAKEVQNSMKLLMKNEPDMIVVESEEERKLGIVYGIQPKIFEKILKTLNCTSENYVTLEVALELDYQNMSLPIISSYGTHCIPALDAFDRIIYYLTVILKVFQRSNTENLQKVFRWIENMMDPLFVEKSVFYLVEVSKIDEVIEKARKDLSRFLTEPEYEVPLQAQYNRNYVFREFEKMLKNLGWAKQHFLATANHILNFMSRELITFKNIHTGYSQMVRLYLQEYRPKVGSFIRSQSSYILGVNDILPDSKSAQPEPEIKTFTGFRKGFLNKSTDSLKKPNAENRDKKNVEEELEKFRKEKSQIEKQLEVERAHLKTMNGNSEKEIRQLRENLEKSQNAKIQLESDLKTQIHTVTVGFDEQVQKVQEELEKSQGANTRLERSMRTLELNHLEDVRLLKANQEKTERNLVLLKEDLRRENVRNIDLENKSRTLEKDCEELKQKMEFLMSENENLRADNFKNTEFQQFLMSENEKLRADNFKNTEFQQKIEEHRKTLENQHCELVDSAWSRLHRLCSKYPESDDVKEAKNDVMRLEDCIDDYMENVEKQRENIPR